MRSPPPLSSERWTCSGITDEGLTEATRADSSKPANILDSSPNSQRFQALPVLPLVVWRVVPEVPESPRTSLAGNACEKLWAVLIEPQLARLNYGIFTLHAVIMSLFIVIPCALRDAGLPLVDHWKVDLPVVLGSFVLMLPAIMGHRDARRLKACFNILEALLSSLTSRLALSRSKGSAIGVYSNVQHRDIRRRCGGRLCLWPMGPCGRCHRDAVLLVIWLVAAAGMRVPTMLATRTYSVPPLDVRQAQALIATACGAGACTKRAS